MKPMLVEEMWAEEILDCFLELAKVSRKELTRQMQITLNQENDWDLTVTGRDILEQLGMDKADNNLWDYLEANNIKTVQQIELNLEEMLSMLKAEPEEPEED